MDFESSAGRLNVCKDGKAVEFSEKTAKEILLQEEIHILIDLKSGDCRSVAWGCDPTYDYVKINGDYRT